MRFYVISPEVAGGLGPNTILATQGHPPVITRLHYLFDGWLGDELLGSFPCFVVTDRLGKELRRLPLTGFELKPVEISASELFRELYPDRTLPEFSWLDVNGAAGVDYFGIDRQCRLVVSQDALSVLMQIPLGQCDISTYQ